MLRQLKMKHQLLRDTAHSRESSSQVKHNCSLNICGKATPLNFFFFLIQPSGTKTVCEHTQIAGKKNVTLKVRLWVSSSRQDRVSTFLPVAPTECNCKTLIQCMEQLFECSEKQIIAGGLGQKTRMRSTTELAMSLPFSPSGLPAIWPRGKHSCGSTVCRLKREPQET